MNWNITLIVCLFVTLLLDISVSGRTLVMVYQCLIFKCTSFTHQCELIGAQMWGLSALFHRVNRFYR